MSPSRIRTTHVGSLPKTQAVVEANRRYNVGAISAAELARVLDEEVAELVARQVEVGLDVVNDGEYGHVNSVTEASGAWWWYSFARLSGLEFRDATIEDVESTGGSMFTLQPFGNRRDWVAFREAYEDPTSGVLYGKDTQAAVPIITGPIRYTGHDLVRRDVDFTLRALEANGLRPEDGFVAALSPGTAARIANQYYGDDEEIVFAFAEALREEYRIITDAGLKVQIDDPGLADTWDQINPEPPLEKYLEFLDVRVRGINHALQGISPDQVRLHVCWGSWRGPHSTDVPFGDIVDTVLRTDARYYSFEAANGRHEHEWEIWEDRALPEDKVLVPGVVSHVSNVVEHPRLVAQRIERFARLVGPERVMASTDCGLGGRVHPQIAWAKLATLTEGARIASERLA